MLSTERRVRIVRKKNLSYQVSRGSLLSVHSWTVPSQDLSYTPLPGRVPPGPAGHRGIVFVPPAVRLLQHALVHSVGFPVDLTVEKRSPIGSVRDIFQLHLCKSMFRAYSIRFFNSDEQPDISRVVSRRVVDILSSLMYVRRYSSFWLQMIIFV